MAEDSPKPKLFVIPKTAPAKTNIIGIDSLDPESRIRVNEILSFSGSQGSVVVGILKGGEDWDLRPLILEAGNLQIVRLASPSLSFSPKSQDALLKLLSDIPNSETSQDISKDNLWYKRRFFELCLADGEEKFFEASGFSRRGEFITALIKEIDSLHSSGLSHGHITAGNICSINGKIIFTDPGLSAFAAQSGMQGIAPEIIRDKLEPNHRSDIYSLGIFFHDFLKDPLNKEIDELIYKMRAQDPLFRPGMKEIKSVLTQERTPSSPAVNTPKIETLNTHVRSAQSFISLKQIVGILAVILIGYLFWQRSGAEPNIPFEEYWSSGQPSLMGEVADAALDGSKAATAVIVRDARDGKGQSVYNRSFIKEAFDSRWERELSFIDRRTVFELGFSPLISRPISGLPNPGKLHPGVLLALVKNTNAMSNPLLTSLPINILAKLPGKLGPASEVLAASGVGVLGDRAVQAFASIVFGDLSEEVVNGLFQGCSEIEKCLYRLSATMQIGMSGESEKLFFTHLPKGAPQLRPLFQWFQMQSIAPWSNVSADIKVSLVSGALPKSGFSFEQLADLLKFPIPEVRFEAAKELLSSRLVPGELGEFLGVLAAKTNRLSRDQTVALLSAMQLEGESAHTFLETWFAGKPDSEVVVSLLATRKNSKKDEAFSLEASRYLSRSDWKAPLSDLEALATHQEPLARVLAYTKLNPAESAERAILERMVALEENPRNKKIIAERLDRLPQN